MNFQRAAVIGSGAMGCGIAQVLSQAGIEVWLKDVEQRFIDKGLANIMRMYDSRVRKETLSQGDAERLFALIHPGTTDQGLEQVDLVIEAALEEIEVKKDIFRKLDKLCPAHTVLASNTSALSISQLAATTRRPAQVLGMHFFNPAQAMKLVEVIPGVKTSAQTVASVLEFCHQVGKIPVKVAECPGFLVNRLLFPYINEALYVLQEGHFDAFQIDQLSTEFGLPTGPFALMDMTGLDICAHVNEFLYGEYGPRFETAPILKRLVKDGFLGQKTNMGIYIHPSDQPIAGQRKEINPSLDKILAKLQSAGQSLQHKCNSNEPFDIYRIILPMFNEAIYAIQEGVVAEQDVDTALKYGTGLNRGLMTIAQENGFAWCHEKLEQYRVAHGERFRPSWYLSKLVRAGIHDFKEITPVPVGVK